MSQMNKLLKEIIFLFAQPLIVGLSSCSSAPRADGWHPVADIPENIARAAR